MEEFIKSLEQTAKANWKSNLRPQDMGDFETYREFLMQSYLLAYKCGFEEKSSS